MKPHFPFSAPSEAGAVGLPDDGSVRKFLFQDDHEFARMVAAFFVPSSQKFSENAGYATAVGAFIIFLGLLGEVGGWQGLKADDERNLAGRGSSGGPAEEALLRVEPSFDQWRDRRFGLGPLSGSLIDDQNYTVASFLDLARDTLVGGGATNPSAIVLAQNTASASSATSQTAQPSSFGGGGGGGGPTGQVASPAEPVIAKVPETGGAALLLGVALALLFTGRMCWSTARSNSNRS